MISEKDEEIFLELINIATNILLTTTKDEQKEKIFPLWQKAVHEILINHGCPCTGQRSGDCFLKLTRESQENIFEDSHPLSLFSLIQYFEEGLDQIILEKTPTEDCGSA